MLSRMGRVPVTTSEKEGFAVPTQAESPAESLDVLVRELARLPRVPEDPWRGLLGNAASPALLLGRCLGKRYVLREILGRGGMGTVYAARNLRTDREVAVKVMVDAQAHEGLQRHRVARFLKEARAAGRIRHPNVVDVYDADWEDGYFYLVMERLYGESLRSLLARSVLSPRDAIAIVLEAAQGVDAAHGLGVVHRDLKPDNIFLHRSPERNSTVVKVLDFGVSRIEGQDLAPFSTGQGCVVGTLAYMPIEQLRGDLTLDHRADVYALGVMLYEAIAGTRPFDEPTAADYLARVASECPRSLKDLVPDVDAELDSIVMRALARAVEDRFPTVRDLIRGLEHWRAIAPPPQRPLHGLSSSTRVARRSVLSLLLLLLSAMPTPSATLVTPRALVEASHARGGESGAAVTVRTASRPQSSSVALNRTSGTTLESAAPSNVSVMSDDALLRQDALRVSPSVSPPPKTRRRIGPLRRARPSTLAQETALRPEDF